MSYSVPSSNNVYIPAFDTTGNLIVDFSRNVSKFKVNQYTTLTPVKKSIGYYLRLGVNNQMRILGEKGDSFAWPDGADAPFGEYNQFDHEFDQYTTTRHVFPAFLGYKMKEQAAWDIQSQFTTKLGVQCMTLRTKLVDDVLTTSSTYDSTHVATATALGGGLWSAGSIANPYIQAGLMAATDIIMKDSNSTIEYTDLCLVINPTTANKMARSAEIRDFIAQSPAAMDQVRGNVPNQNGQWGLPEILYGFKLVVEQTTYVSTPAGSNTQTKSFTFPDNKAVITCRSGKDLVNNAGLGSGNYSTVNVISYSEMNAETFDDTINRRHIMRVTDDYAVEAVAPVTGFLVTNLFS